MDNLNVHVEPKGMEIPAVVATMPREVTSARGVRVVKVGAGRREAMLEALWKLKTEAYQRKHTAELPNATNPSKDKSSIAGSVSSWRVSLTEPIYLSMEEKTRVKARVTV